MKPLFVREWSDPERQALQAGLRSSDGFTGRPCHILLPQSPRQWGKARSTWTLALAAEVCAEHGITAERVSYETIRDALKRLGVGWRRAKPWITSPDPQSALKKTGATA